MSERTATARWTAVGLTEDEYRRIVGLLGREPNDVELGMYGLMWSEHCSYKTSKPVLKVLPTSGPRVLQGPGENAGVVNIGDGLAVAFKIESHNHPSAIEPYQGAATGVGGIIRDIFTMGARPVAILDSLRFGELDDPRTKYLFGGVVAGIGGYGNCIGIATVGGEVYFEEPYRGNPLVNAMCVGILPVDGLIRGTAAGAGNAVMLVGARTGRDGIHGASLLASKEFDEKAEERRPAVQVGDPFLEKLLLEACLEVLETGAVVGIQDLGAAGLTSATSETASRAGSGMDIDIALVPRREEGMTPYEVMLSESQERMLIIVRQGREKEVEAVFRKWGLNSVVIGRVTGDGILRVRENGLVVAEIPAQTLAADAPVYHRPTLEPAYLTGTRAFDPATLTEPGDYSGVLVRLLRSPNLASKGWVWRQYDHMVRLHTVVTPGADAAVLRLPGTRRGLALATDGNGRYCYLDPYRGGSIAVAEAARNVACTGAEPAAITNCLNFGNPERPEIFWQFQQVVEGMAAACRALDTPVTGGNVSFYNETLGENIYPTPVVGMLGILDDIDRRCTPGFKAEGDLLALLGELAADPADLGGSEYLKVIHGLVAGRPPRLDLERERRVQRACLEAIREGLVSSAHDCADGGLAVALAECCFAGEQGVKGAVVDLSAGGRVRRDALLFGETQSRILLSLPAKNLDRLEQIAAAHGAPLTMIGRVGGERLSVSCGGEPLIDLAIPPLEVEWREVIECLMK